MGEYLGMKKYSLILLALFLSMPCFASQNVINSVLISKSKEDPSKYELNIDSTDVARYKMHKDEQGVWFELKNSVMAKDMGTIYDDVSDIDSVSVKATDSKITWSHSTSGVTAQEYAGTSNSGNVAYGATITIPKFTVNATGHVTSAGTTTFKLPTSDNTRLYKS